MSQSVEYGVEHVFTVMEALVDDSQGSSRDRLTAALLHFTAFVLEVPGIEESKAWKSACATSKGAKDIETVVACVAEERIEQLTYELWKVLVRLAKAGYYSEAASE